MTINRPTMRVMSTWSSPYPFPHANRWFFFFLNISYFTVLFVWPDQSVVTTSCGGSGSMGHLLYALDLSFFARVSKHNNLSCFEWQWLNACSYFYSGLRHGDQLLAEQRAWLSLELCWPRSFRRDLQYRHAPRRLGHHVVLLQLPVSRYSL